MLKLYVRYITSDSSRDDSRIPTYVIETINYKVYIILEINILHQITAIQ